jgi:chromosome segregation ATPase/SAM-dependent methyltransferase
MQLENASAHLFHLLARYTYLQSFLERQRVLVLGQAESSSADALARQGIRRAVFIDSVESRIERARRGSNSRRVEFLAGPLERVALVEDSFDVAIIEDFGAVKDRTRVLAAAKRGLTPQGLLVACVPNPDAPDGFVPNKNAQLGYYEFYGQLADSFPQVRMVGQCPFVGFALVDLGVDDPESRVFDDSLLHDGSEDAEYFVALCSREPIKTDPFAVVQVPLSWVSLARGQGPVAQTPALQPADVEVKAPAAREKPAAKTASKPAAAPDKEKASKDQGTEFRRRTRQLEREAEDSAKEITRLKLEIDKRAVTIAKLENYLREAREKAATEHDRVIQTKIALEAEKKKLLNLSKEVEMGRRIQRMAPAREAAPSAAAAASPDSSQDAEKLREVEKRAALCERHKGELEKRLAVREKEVQRHREDVRQVTAQLEQLRAESANIDSLKADLAARTQACEAAEARAVAAERKAARAESNAADLAKERGARKLAEAHAAELEQRLKDKVKKAAAAAGPRPSPAQSALEKAQAAFGAAGVSSADLSALHKQLDQERRARVLAEEQLGLLRSQDGAGQLQTELEQERKNRAKAEESLTQMESRLSQAEATAARMTAQDQARKRAEQVFGAVSGGSEERDAFTAELAQEREQRLKSEAELLGLQTKLGQLQELEEQLLAEQEAREQAESRLAEGPAPVVDPGLADELEQERQKRQRAEKEAREAQQAQQQAAKKAGEAQQAQQQAATEAREAQQAQQQAAKEVREARQAQQQAEKTLAVQRDQASQQARELRQAQAAATAARDELAAATAKLERIPPQRQRGHGRELQELTSRQRQLEAELAQERERRNRAEAETSQLQQELAYSQTIPGVGLETLRAMEQAAAETAPSSARDREQLQKLEQRLEEQEAQCKGARAALSSLEATHENEVGRLEELLRERAEKIMHLSGELDQRSDLLRHALEDLQAQHRQLPETGTPESRADDAAEYRRSLDDAQQQVAELSRRLQERDQSLAELTSEVQSLNWQLDERQLVQPDEQAEAYGGQPIEIPLLSLSGEKAQPGTPPAPAPAEGPLVASLEKELARLQGRAEILERDRDQTKEELDTVRGELRQSLRQNARLEAEQHTSHDQMSTLKTELADATRSREDLQAAVTKERERVTDFARQLAETAGQAKVLERSLVACREEREGLKAEVVQARQELGALGRDGRELTQRCDDLSQQLSETFTQLEQRQTELTSLRACLNVLEEQVPGVKDALKQAGIPQAPAVSPMSTWVRLSRLLSPRTAAKEEAGIEELHELRRELAEARAGLDAAKQRETALLERLDELNKRLESDPLLQQRVAELEKELASCSERAARLVGELAQAQAAASLAQGELGDAQNKADNAGLEAAQLTAQVEQLETALAQAQEEYIRLQQQAAPAQDELRRLRQELDREREGTQALQSDLDRQQTVVEELQNKVAAADEAGPARGNGHPTAEAMQPLLDQAHQGLARSDGAAAGYVFRIAELEQQLTLSQGAASSTATLVEELQLHRQELARQRDENRALESKCKELAEAGKGSQDGETLDRPDREQLRQSLAEAQRRLAELEFVGERAEEWAERMEQAERESTRLRDELDHARHELVQLEGQQASGETPAVAGDGQGESAPVDLDLELAQLRRRVAQLEEEKSNAEQALERVMEGFSAVSGDAVALADILVARDELIQYLQKVLAERRDAKLSSEEEVPEVTVPVDQAPPRSPSDEVNQG